MSRINVTKSFLPPIEEYEAYLKKIWDSGQLTNQGPLLKEFEDHTKKYLGLERFHFVTNGTLALQLALKAVGVNGGEVITTPFSYVATTSAILWENATPVYADIDPETLNLDPQNIEELITPETKAILPVHVFGNPCDVEEIEKIAKKHSIKVIYDAAHAFGVTYKKKSLLSWGDISVCSFHATKLFQTIEGGCVVVNDDNITSDIELMKRFGHRWNDHQMLGINAKASEFQAAMGLCSLNYIDDVIAKRKQISSVYDGELKDTQYKKPKIREETEYNYSYYPVIFRDEESLLQAKKKLEKENIFPRRYFYPSLNTLPYLENKQSCPVSEGVAKKILSLPLYSDLNTEEVKRITEVLC